MISLHCDPLFENDSYVASLETVDQIQCALSVHANDEVSLHLKEKINLHFLETNIQTPSRILKDDCQRRLNFSECNDIYIRFNVH